MKKQGFCKNQDFAKFAVGTMGTMGTMVTMPK